MPQATSLCVHLIDMRDGGIEIGRESVVEIPCVAGPRPRSEVALLQMSCGLWIFWQNGMAHSLIAPVLIDLSKWLGFGFLLSGFGILRSVVGESVPEAEAGAVKASLQTFFASGLVPVTVDATARTLIAPCAAGQTDR